MDVTWIAYVATAKNDLGADPGISIYRKELIDGGNQVASEQEIARMTLNPGEIDETDTIYGDYAGAAGIEYPNGNVDEEKLTIVLATLGYELAGDATWSGGQWAYTVQPL